MATTLKLMAQASGTDGGPDTLYTVPGATTAVIKNISITNKHASTAYSFDLTAGDLAAEKYLRKSVSVAAGDTFAFSSEGHDFIVLEAADVLKFTSANGTQFDIMVFGIEET